MVMKNIESVNSKTKELEDSLSGLSLIRLLSIDGRGPSAQFTVHLVLVVLVTCASCSVMTSRDCSVMTSRDCGVMASRDCGVMTSLTGPRSACHSAESLFGGMLMNIIAWGLQVRRQVTVPFHHAKALFPP